MEKTITFDFTMSDSDSIYSDAVITKLKRVLTKLLLFNFKCSDDTILIKLFDYLTAPGDSTQAQILKEVFYPWFEEALAKWDLIVFPVKVLVLKLLGYFSKEVKSFHQIVQSGLLSRLISSMKKNKELDNISVAMGYLEMLTDISQHEEGLKWIVENGAWRDVVPFAHNCLSIYVLKKSWTFISNLIVNLANIMLPVAQIIFKESITSLNQNDKSMGETNNPKHIPTTRLNTTSLQKDVLINTSKLAIEIISNILNHLSFKTASMILEGCKINDWAWTIMHDSDDIQMVTVASRLICFSNALVLCDVVNHEVPQIISQKFIYSIITHFNLLVARHGFQVVFDSTVEYQILWEKHGGKVMDGHFNPKSESVDEHESEVYKTENAIYRVQNFLLIVEVLPLFLYTKIKSKEMECDKLLELYIEKLYKVACPKTIRFCYYLRDQLSNQESDMEILCIQNVHKIVQISSICNKDQAVLIFQAFIHILKYIVIKYSNDNQVNPAVVYYNTQDMDTERITSPLINGLCTYLSKFKFSWRDSLESVCIMSVAQSIINKANIAPKLCTETLRLINLLLLNFMPPNLALLVNTLQGSSIKDLGKQLLKTIKSLHWEVRDSTLEVLTTISILAEAKFPAFQTLLLEQGFPDLIITLMDSDAEAYVRASAITCISEMSKIKPIWESHLQDKRLMDKICMIMHFESEGVIRKQAALLANEIYKNRHIPCDLLNQTYDTFYYVAKSDLYWEVKINALEFWDTVVDYILSEEGMTDGLFPEAIFSKEKKKIIQLTSAKKCHLVLKAFEKLGSIGCLCILWATLLDECDSEVQKRSAKLVMKLKKIVDRYNVMPELNRVNFNKDELDNYHLEKPSEDILQGSDIDIMMICDNTDEKGVFPNKLLSLDEVINQIVTEEDIQLLPNLIQNDEKDRKLPKIRRFIIPAEDFIEKVMSLDVERLLNERKTWAFQTTEGVESLLDDILQFTKEDEFFTNAIDCY